MNEAKALLSSAYEWALRTGKVAHSPMVGFQLPKSTYVSRDKLAPEATKCPQHRREVPLDDGTIAVLRTVVAEVGATSKPRTSARQRLRAGLRGEQANGAPVDFNLSLNGFRKFTSSELAGRPPRRRSWPQPPLGARAWGRQVVRPPALVARR